MPVVVIDGVRREVDPGTTLASLLSNHPRNHAVAVIRPGEQEASVTRNLRFVTSAGEMVIEFNDQTGLVPDIRALLPHFRLKWADRYAAAFGPFLSGFQPARKPSRYERGEILIGCGGYDPGQSYLIFSRMRHLADHGAGESGNIVGRVVYGRGVIDRFSEGDTILSIEPVVSFSDTTHSFTTTDMDTVLEEGMQVISEIRVRAMGFSPEKINPATAASVEHLLVALEKGSFQVGRSTSTHIRDSRFAGTDVPQEYQGSRREGAVTVRTRGKARGAVYFYTEDLPSARSHTIAGQITHGIELASLAREGDTLLVTAEPARFDLVGLPTAPALDEAEKRGISVISDCKAVGGEYVIISQTPGTTLEVLHTREVELETVPFSEVIDIMLDDERAPVTCDIFRRITGLSRHNVGRIPFFFHFDDVFLFRPKVPAGVRIDPENTPLGPVAANTLAMTNDSRKGTGMVGVRGSENTEFGPTSEPFDGTNIIGRVIDPSRLKEREEGKTVYIREVGP